jgi:glucosamine-6-phosphate deaminase
MDEYVKLNKDAPQGFGNFIRDRLWGKVPMKSVNYLNGNSLDLETECVRYTELLKTHPIDIVCLGIGENGHLAFNDPPVADFNDRETVKVVELEERCRQQQVNDGCFKSLDEVPTHALSLTIPALMSGKYLFAMVPGKTKTEAVFNTVTSDIDKQCPATIMREHSHAKLFIDIDSAALLLKSKSELKSVY